MAHSPLVKVNLVELELLLKPSPLISAKHRHVLPLVSVRPVLSRVTWLLQDELRDRIIMQSHLLSHDVQRQVAEEEDAVILNLFRICCGQSWKTIWPIFTSKYAWAAITLTS